MVIKVDGNASSVAHGRRKSDLFENMLKFAVVDVTNAVNACTSIDVLPSNKSTM